MASEGGVEFKYEPLGFVIGGGRSDTLLAKLEPKPEKLATQPETSDHLPPDEPLVEEPADEFLGFDDTVDDIIEIEPAVLAESKPLDALLHDYIALDLLDDVKRASKKAEPQPSRPELLKDVPWRGSLVGMKSPLVRLHHEIVEFCRYVQPSAEEDGLRKAAIKRVADVVNAIWPSAEVAVFGSFATGLHLPTSDVDLVVLGSGCKDIPSGLKALANSLVRKNIAKNMQVIAKAKVPIVKFEERESSYNFDISFDVANGPEAAHSVNSLMQSLPPMKHLVMVLKVFLQQRELNEVYSGGLGSYALLVLVAAFLQTHPSRHRQVASKTEKRPKKRAKKSAKEDSPAPVDALEPNLGLLLLDFLRLYGRALRHTHVGVSCRKGGAFFKKQSRGFHQEERPYMLAVEDPNDPSNDLGRNSFNISKVRMAFDFAYCQLIAPIKPGESLLQRVIRLDPVLFARAPPVAMDDRPVGSPKAAAHSTPKEKTKGGRNKNDQDQESPVVDNKGDGQEETKKERKRRKHRERSASDEDLDDSSPRAKQQTNPQQQRQQQRESSETPPEQKKKKNNKPNTSGRADAGKYNAATNNNTQRGGTTSKGDGNNNSKQSGGGWGKGGPNRNIPQQQNGGGRGGGSSKGGKGNNNDDGRNKKHFDKKLNGRVDKNRSKEKNSGGGGKGKSKHIRFS